jgi:hypothetical protein
MLRSTGPSDRAKNRTSAEIFPSLHSHTMITRQPAAFSAALTSRSRLMFPSNLRSQNSWRVFGLYASPQSCRCQKHPWTRMTVRLDRKTMSGRPGRSRACRRKRYPIPCSSLRTSFSGPVSRPRMRDMSSLRFSGDMMSQRRMSVTGDRRSTVLMKLSVNRSGPLGKRSVSTRGKLLGSPSHNHSAPDKSWLS